MASTALARQILPSFGSVLMSDPPETLKLLEKTASSPPAGRLPTARSRTVAPEVEQPPVQPPVGTFELRGCL